MSVSEFREWAERELAFITDLVARIEAGDAVLAAGDLERLKQSERDLAKWLSLTHSPDET